MAHGSQAAASATMHAAWPPQGQLSWAEKPGSSASAGTESSGGTALACHFEDLDVAFAVTHSHHLSGLDIQLLEKATHSHSLGLPRRQELHADQVRPWGECHSDIASRRRAFLEPAGRAHLNRHKEGRGHGVARRYLAVGCEFNLACWAAVWGVEGCAHLCSDLLAAHWQSSCSSWRGEGSAQGSMGAAALDVHGGSRSPARAFSHPRYAGADAQHTCQACTCRATTSQ